MVSNSVFMTTTTKKHSKKSNTPSRVESLSQLKKTIASQQKTIVTQEKTIATQAKTIATQARELRQAAEQQTATSEILGVIASSPTDLQPVLDAVAENAARLCESNDAVIHRVDGDLLRRVAHYGHVPAPPGRGEEVPLSHGWIAGRAVVDRETIHVH